MTTTAPTAPESLMREARDLAARERRIPSKRALARALSVRFERASTIHAVLVAESEQRRREREHEKRATPPRPRLESTAPDRPAAAPETGATEAGREPEPAAVEAPSPQVSEAADAPSPVAAASLPGRVSRWPLFLLAAPAFVAIWAGWVDLGRLTGFGAVRLLPGIADSWSINTAITLPIGLETYAAYALYVWLARVGSGRARKFAAVSALLSLLLGFAGQAAYHLMIAAGMTGAPWPITLAISGVPVAVLGMGAALWHLVHTPEEN